MAPVAVHTRLRPLRAAFLVDPLDRRGLSDVLRVATCMWGGPFCPLIPVSDRLPEAWRDELHDPEPREMTNGYLRFFEPDLFIETRQGQLQQAGMGDPRRISAERICSFESLVRDREGVGTLSVGVDTEAVYRHLYRTEYQFQRHDTPRLVDFDKGEAVGEAFFEAAYGMFPEWAETTTRAAYTSLGPQTVCPTADAWRLIELERRNCPLDYANHGIRPSYGRSFPALSLSFFVFDPCAATDVIDFWNLRQFVPNVRPVNVHWLAASRDTVLEMLDVAVRGPGQRGQGIRAAVHLSRSIKTDCAKEVLDLPATLSMRVLTLEHYEAIWRPPREHGPRMASLSVRQAKSELVPREGSTAFVRVPVLEPYFTVVPRWGGPTWANVMRTSFDGSDHRFAMAVPSAALDQRMLDDFHMQYPSREGDVILPAGYPSSYRDLHLPTMNEAVAAWLKARSLDVARSHAGRIAEQIIEAVGGLRGTSIIRRLEIVELLDGMARSRVERGGDSEAYPDRTASVQEVRRGLGGGTDSESALERLVEAGALRLGAAVPCPHCERENWFSLDDIATVVGCDRCLGDFRFPQGFPTKRLWKYRVAGAFATPNYAEGGYSVALTLAALSRATSGFEDALTFSTGMEMMRDGTKLEADFVAWHRQVFAIDDPTTLIGECKSLAKGAFRDEDVAKLKTLARWLPGSRLVVACMKPALEADEQKCLAGLALWGWRCGDSPASQSPLIVLTGGELFAHNLRDAWHDRGGRHADLTKDLGSLDHLAIATQELYLGLDRDTILTATGGDGGRGQAGEPAACT